MSIPFPRPTPAAMRILIVSFRFPPHQSMGAVRVGKMAKCLVELGADVRVLTAADQNRPATLAQEIEEARVVRTKWLDLYGRMGFRSTEGVALSSGAAAHRPSLARRLASGVGRLRDWQGLLEAESGWYGPGVRGGRRLIEGWRPDIIYASAWPVTSLLVGRALSRQARVPWVAELRDLWADNPQRAFAGLHRWVAERMERRVLASAAGIVTVSEPMAAGLQAKHGKPTVVVLNGYDPTDYPARRPQGHRDDSFRLVYTGQVYGGRDPAPLLGALALLDARSQPVRAVFYGPDGELVRQAARQIGVEQLVEVHGPVPHAEALRAQVESDALVLLTWDNPGERGVYTGKLFEYIGARRPILVVGARDSVAADLVRERGLGAVANEPAEIADQLASWARAKAEGGALPSPPAEAAAGLSRQEQASALVGFLAGLGG